MNEAFLRKVKADLTDTAFEVAVLADVDELNTLFARFFAESGYSRRGIVYDEIRSRRWIQGAIELGRAPHFVARLEGQIVGAISYDIDDTFSERPVAVLHCLYVVPEHRKSAIGRMLVGLACDAAKVVDKCVAFHAPACSGMDEMASLENLFAKAGFKPIGFIMGRSL